MCPPGITTASRGAGENPIAPLGNAVAVADASGVDALTVIVGVDDVVGIVGVGENASATVVAVATGTEPVTVLVALGAGVEVLALVGDGRLTTTWVAVAVGTPVFVGLSVAVAVGKVVCVAVAVGKAVFVDEGLAVAVTVAVRITVGVARDSTLVGVDDRHVPVGVAVTFTSSLLKIVWSVRIDKSTSVYNAKNTTIAVMPIITGCRSTNLYMGSVIFLRMFCWRWRESCVDLFGLVGCI